MSGEEAPKIYGWRSIFLEIFARLLLFGICFWFEKTPAFIQVISVEEWEKSLNPHKKDTVSEGELALTAGVSMILLTVSVLIIKFYSARKVLREKRGQASQSSILLHYIIYDFYDFFLAFSLGASLYFLTGSMLKVIVGRPRPDYFDRCWPSIFKENDTQLIKDTIRHHLDASFYDSNLYQYVKNKKFPEAFGMCESPEDSSLTANLARLKVLNNGRRSFPSGHSGTAFNVFVFLALYTWGKTGAFNFKKRALMIRSYSVISGILLIFPAVWIAASRLSDYRHHTEDVIAGALLGTFFACLGYFVYYPSLKSENPHRSYNQQVARERSEVKTFVELRKERSKEKEERQSLKRQNISEDV